MDIKSLQIFLHLAQHLHFAQTAQQFFVSPPTLSRIIQRLEQTVGTPLFERDKRHVKLTKAGETFEQFAQLQLQQWQQLQHQLSTEQQQLTGQLTLYCSVTAAYSHLPSLLDRFRTQYPKVEIILTTGDAANAVASVQQQQQAIAIAAKPKNLPNNVMFHQLALIDMVLIAPKQHQFNIDLHQLSAQSLPQLPLIIADHGVARARMVDWLKQHNVSLKQANIYAQVSGNEAIVSMVALGCGLALVPKVVLANSPVAERIQVLDLTQQVPPLILGVCYLQKPTLAPVVKAFLSSLAKE